MSHQVSSARRAVTPRFDLAPGLSLMQYLYLLASLGGAACNGWPSHAELHAIALPYMRSRFVTLGMVAPAAVAAGGGRGRGFIFGTIGALGHQGADGVAFGSGLEPPRLHRRS